MSKTKRKKIKVPSAVNRAIHEESASHIPAEEHRPRDLGVSESLFHLDADWGTSLAYILPLSLAFTGRLAPIYMIIIAFVMFVVANGYKIVCRHNPDGGGVYSSLRKVNKFLAVVGALLLVTDYIVTQALSVSDSFHYLHMDDALGKGELLHPLLQVFHSPAVVAMSWTILIIILLTVINWKGPHFSAKFAGLASAPTFLLASFLAIIAIPYLPKGIMNMGHFNQSVFEVLRNTTSVLLALSGVEAISNMTGIMKDPERTSRRAINIELMKVVFTTVILGIAMNGMPNNVVYVGKTVNGTFHYNTQKVDRTDLNCYINKATSYIQHKPYECPQTVVPQTRADMLVAMSEFLLPGPVGKVYGFLIGLVYACLLIFAGNTALIDITNVTYALGRDNELPAGYTKLNKKYGVPIWGLVTAGIAPIITVLIVGANIEALASLYAIGVVGAIALNLSGTMLQVKGRERWISGFGAVMMSVLFITLVVTKMEATIFASMVLVCGLTARSIQKYFMQVRGGIEPILRSSAIASLPPNQILVPIYDEFNESLFDYVGRYASKVKKDVVILYLHDPDPVLEENITNPQLDYEGRTYLKTAQEILKKHHVKSRAIYDFSEDYGISINRYRKKIKPEVTFITTPEEEGAVEFLSGGIVQRLFASHLGKVLIYADN